MQRTQYQLKVDLDSSVDKDTNKLFTETRSTETHNQDETKKNAAELRARSKRPKGHSVSPSKASQMDPSEIKDDLTTESEFYKITRRKGHLQEEEPERGQVAHGHANFKKTKQNPKKESSEKSSNIFSFLGCCDGR